MASSSQGIQGVDTVRGHQKVSSTGTLHNFHSKKNLSKNKVHSRSLSSNRLLHRVTSGPSSQGAQTQRPNLGRSKSTDGLIRRNGHKKGNRSFTKLSGFQPLSKTMSNQSLRYNKSSSSLKGMSSGTCVSSGGLRSSGRKGKAIMKLNDDGQDSQHYEDLIDTSEFDRDDSDDNKAFHKNEGESETFNTNLSHTASKEEMTQSQSHFSTDDASSDKKTTQEGSPMRHGIDNLDSSNSEGTEEIQKPTFFSRRKDDGKQTEKVSPRSISSKDDLSTHNLYGGSFLLSQSTGLTKKIDTGTNANRDGNGNVMIVPQGDSFGESQGSEQAISFKAKPMTSALEPVVTNKTVSQNNSYQPHQTIFNNLQRTNSQYLTSKRQQSQKQQTFEHQENTQNESSLSQVVKNGTTNFTDYLSKQHSFQPESSMDTRTQQRLWLQRESSLLDVSNLDATHIPNLSSLSLNHMHHNSVNHSPVHARHNSSQNFATPRTPSGSSQPGIHENNGPTDVPAKFSGMNGLFYTILGHQNSIQSRTEYERFNREYLNVRRHLNPVGESLGRLEKQAKGESIPMSKTRPHAKSPSLFVGNRDRNNATFQEYSHFFEEHSTEANQRLNNIWQDAVMLSSSVTPPSKVCSNQNVPSAVPQRPSNPREASYNKLMSSQTPTTRAVKLAAAHAAAQSNRIASTE